MTYLQYLKWRWKKALTPFPGQIKVEFLILETPPAVNAAALSLVRPNLWDQIQTYSTDPSLLLDKRTASKRSWVSLQRSPHLLEVSPLSLLLGRSVLKACVFNLQPYNLLTTPSSPLPTSDLLCLMKDFFVVRSEDDTKIKDSLKQGHVSQEQPLLTGAARKCYSWK